VKYKVTFKGGTGGTKEEERLIDAAHVDVGDTMTMLLSAGSDPFALLVVPNDRIISIEKM
jgi:hypothetical protein